LNKEDGLTVLLVENLRVGLGVGKDGTRTIPSRIFDLFPLLKQMLNRRGGDLSAGQQTAARDRPRPGA
jgi:ABC-type branched-subunit amino acid transport system ATPase component